MVGEKIVKEWEWDMSDKPDECEFECDECGHIFNCGVINLERNTIFCPKCDREIESKLPLYEYDCFEVG